LNRPPEVELLFPTAGTNFQAADIRTDPPTLGAIRIATDTGIMIAIAGTTVGGPVAHSDTDILTHTRIRM
jgi:hypothetical protein